MNKNKVKPILLTHEQVLAIKKLQETEKQKSPLGCAPSIHAIARSLMDKALSGIMA